VRKRRKGGKKYRNGRGGLRLEGKRERKKKKKNKKREKCGRGDVCLVGEK
jgi:hypothetical protein